MVAPSSAEEAGQAGGPETLGTPVRAKLAHASCIVAASARISADGSPVRNEAPGASSALNTNGISSAWHDLRTPPNAGVGHVNRYSKVGAAEPERASAIRMAG